jgi:hypothetical protein
MKENSPLRAEAEQYFKDGFCFVVAAFDLAGTRQWRFGEHVERRARACLDELFDLFHDSQLEEKPKTPYQLLCEAREVSSWAGDGDYVLGARRQIIGHAFRLGWKGNAKLRAEVAELYRPETK